MGRHPREILPGGYFHCINRGVGRREIFHEQRDYETFVHLMRRSQKKYPVNISAYCIMPNHWHIVLSAETGKHLARFFSSLLNSHTKWYHAKNKSIGNGPIYQGRYKSLPIPEEAVHSVCRYVERNPLAALLVADACDWPWSSHRYWIGELNTYGPALSRPFVEDATHWAKVVGADPLNA